MRIEATNCARMVVMEMKQEVFLLNHPATKIVIAENNDIATISTGKCSTRLCIVYSEKIKL